MDALTLQAVIDECKDLNGSRIVAVDQYGPTELGLVLKGMSGRRVLFLSVHPSFARVHLADPSMKSAASSAVLTVLRDHLLPGIMEEIVAVPFERVVEIRCVGRTSLGSRRYRLIAELIGNRGVLVFMSEPDQVILETLRRIRGPARSLVPGETYTSPPPMEKTPLFDATREMLDGSGSPSTPEALVRDLTGVLAGLSREMAVEIVAHAGWADEKALADTDADTRAARLWSSLRDLVLRVKSREWTPCLGRNSEGRPRILSAVPIHSLPEEQIEYHESISGAAARFYEERIAEEETKQRTKTVQRALRDEIQRLERLAGNLDLDLEHVQREAEYRRYGDLITSHLGQLKTGMTEARVEDYYSGDQEEIVIALKPDLSPAENARRYFRQARKARDGRRAVEHRIARTGKRLEEVKGIRGKLGDAPDEIMLEGAYRACARLKLVKAPAKTDASTRNRNRAKGDIHPRRFLTTSGHLLLVGRNSRENEALTKSAAPDDIWLHARNLGGSHVILRRVDRTHMPSKKTLYEAACLTAYYSKGRGSTTVPVDYTERRYVRKMKNGGPGQVIFTREKTLFVEPRLELNQAVPSDATDDGSTGASMD